MHPLLYQNTELLKTTLAGLGWLGAHHHDLTKLRDMRTNAQHIQAPWNHFALLQRDTCVCTPCRVLAA